MECVWVRGSSTLLPICTYFSMSGEKKTKVGICCLSLTVSSYDDSQSVTWLFHFCLPNIEGVLMSAASDWKNLKGTGVLGDIVLDGANWGWIKPPHPCATCQFLSSPPVVSMQDTRWKRWCHRSEILGLPSDGRENICLGKLQNVCKWKTTFCSVEATWV